MKNMSKIKKGLNWLACGVVAFVMALSFGITAAVPNVKAETPIDYNTIAVSGGQFEASSSKVIKTPSSWNDSYVGDFTGNVISGIINLGANADTEEDFMEETKLDSYQEYANEKPVTPFGRNTTNPKDNWYFPGTNSNVLMINTNDVDSKRGTAFGYTSEAIELAANSFYKFSVWVKTGSFVQDRGAVVKLSGFDYDIGFWNIDNSLELTNPENEMLGFSEYVIYVATAQNSVSAKINLQVGDSYIYGTYGEPDYIEYVTPSSGYAFFDNVTCVQLSANAYYRETVGAQSDTVIVKDFNDTVGIISSEILTSKLNGPEFDMGSFANGLQGWHTPEDVAGGYRYLDTYDVHTAFSEDNLFGLESDPYSPNGNHEYLSDSNILVMSAKTDATVGLESDGILIERNKFYRISVWANTQGFDDDSNAELRIVGESNIAFDDYELSPVKLNPIEGSDDINNRYGWKKYSFYIRGSVSRDCTVNLQLWLGRDKACTGTVLFDEIVFEELTYTYYNNNYSNGTQVIFDSNPSTTIDNGRFFEAENYGEAYPLVPVQWTSFGELTGNGVSGIILTDEEHYNQNYTTYLGVTNPVSASTNVKYNSVRYPSMLLLASDELGYFGYTSPDLSIIKGNEYKISVTMRTINMEGAGANLWVEVNGKTLASVKNITSTAEFTTYEFYLQGDTAFEDGTGIDYTARLHIALGNKANKAAGSIYVAEAALETVAEGTFDSKYAEYKEERAAGISYDMYSFKSLDFFGYDNTDSNTIKASTNWNVSEFAEQGEGSYEAGVFNPNKKDNNANNAYIPAEITTAYNKLENKFDNVFTLQARNTAVSAQLINPLKIEADSYYMVTVSMAVIIHDGVEASTDGYGAGLYLSGDESYSGVKFTNIRTTSNLVDKYEFRTYQFYVASSNTKATLYLRASLGDIAYPNRYVSGELYIAYVSLVNLGSSDDTLVESDTLKIINNHVDVEEETPEEQPEQDPSTTNDNEKWWLIPSILLGVAIVIALVGVVIRIVADKFSRRQRKQQLSSYDRRYGYAEPSNDNSEKLFDDNEIEAPAVPKIIDQDIEKFNDDDESETVTQKTVTPEPVEKAPAQKIEDTDVNNDFDD